MMVRHLKSVFGHARAFPSYVLMAISGGMAGIGVIVLILIALIVQSPDQDAASVNDLASKKVSDICQTSAMSQGIRSEGEGVVMVLSIAGGKETLAKLDRETREVIIPKWAARMDAVVSGCPGYEAIEGCIGNGCEEDPYVKIHFPGSSG